MEVLGINEHEDKSATLSINCTDEEVEFLIGYAIRDILKKALDSMDFNPKDYIYDGATTPYCMGQSDGNRKCPVCGISTNSMLPISWYEGHEDHLRTYHAFFCKEHKPGDLR